MMGRRFRAAVRDGLLDCARDVCGRMVLVLLNA
jgi:predicted DNA-binding protein (UPF0278 family)